MIRIAALQQHLGLHRARGEVTVVASRRVERQLELLARAGHVIIREQDVGERGARAIRERVRLLVGHLGHRLLELGLGVLEIAELVVGHAQRVTTELGLGLARELLQRVETAGLLLVILRLGTGERACPLVEDLGFEVVWRPLEDILHLVDRVLALVQIDLGVRTQDAGADADQLAGLVERLRRQATRQVEARVEQLDDRVVLRWRLAVPRDRRPVLRRERERTALEVRLGDPREEPRLGRHVLRRVRFAQRLEAVRVVFDPDIAEREREVAIRGDSRPIVLLELDVEVLDRVRGLDP